MRNNAFYVEEEGKQIMDTDNFSKEVIRYLNYEQAFISKVLSRGRYDVLIELGCDEVRLYGACAMNGVSYIGVDIRKSLKSFIDEYFVENTHVESQFINSCLSKYHERLDLGTKKVLCVFPFNLIGNLDDSINYIKSCFSYGFDVIVSQFNTTDKANEIRREYYHKCGILNLTFKSDRFGDSFTGFGFESNSIFHENLIEYCSDAGYLYNDSFISNLICISHFLSGKK